MEKLEQATEPVEDHEAIVFHRVSFLQGELIALDGEGITVNRLPGETERQLYDRVVIEVRKSPPSLPCTKDEKLIYMLGEVRERSESDDDWKKNMGVAKVVAREPEHVQERELRERIIPNRRPGAPRKPVIDIKRPDGPTAGHWIMG